MPPGDFDALVRATRWCALTPFLSPDGAQPLQALPLISPAFGAVQVEDFQLVFGGELQKELFGNVVEAPRKRSLRR